MSGMTGSRLFAELMHCCDVSHVFFMPTFMHKGLAEMEDMPIRRIMLPGEQAAAYLADGCARASNKPGICSSLNQEINLAHAAYGGKARGRGEEPWRFPPMHFARVAEAFGCVGIRVENPGDLNDTLQSALAINKSVVVDVVNDTYAIAGSPGCLN